jgi:hypothetical protein
MKLKYDNVTIRFFLPWKQAVKVDHDVSHRGLNDAADAIVKVPCVDSVDIGSGHCGMYFDIEMNCEPTQIHNCIDDVVKYAKSLKIRPTKNIK